MLEFRIKAEAALRRSVGSMVFAIFFALARSAMFACGYSLNVDTNGDRFSSHYCTGPVDATTYKNAYLERTCFFRNVCYKRSSEQWLYFKGADGLMSPLLWEPEGSVFDSDSLPYLQLTATNFVFGQHAMHHEPWNLTVVNEQFPTNYTMRSRLHVLYRTTNGLNHGHIISDDLVAIYGMLDNFDLYSRSVQVIHIGQHSSLQEKLNSLLFDPPLRTLTDINSFHDVTCFEQLLLGSGSFATSNTYGSVAYNGFRPAIFRRIRELILHQMQLPVNYRIKRPFKVVILSKRGRGEIHNMEEITQYFRRMQDVEVEIRSATEKTFEDDVRVLSETSLVVTPNGGISFNCIFLPKHASVVVMDDPPLPGHTFRHRDYALWMALPWLKVWMVPFTGDPEKQLAHLNMTYMHEYVEVTRKYWSQVPLE